MLALAMRTSAKAVWHASLLTSGVMPQVGLPLPMELRAEAVGCGQQRRSPRALEEALRVLGPPSPLRIRFADADGATGQEVYLLDRQSPAAAPQVELAVDPGLLQGEVAPLGDFIVAATRLPAQRQGLQITLGQHPLCISLPLRHGDFHSLRILSPPSGASAWLRTRITVLAGVPSVLISAAASTLSHRQHC